MAESNLNNIVDSLTGNERKVIAYLKSSGLTEDIIISDIVNGTNLQEIEVMRASQWLGNKDVLTFRREEKDTIILGKNGIDAKDNGFAEKRFLLSFKDDMDAKLTVDEISKKANLSPQEVNISIGQLKRNGLVEIEKGDGLIASLTEKGKKEIDNETSEEKILKKEFPVFIEDLSEDEQVIVKDLLKRKDILVRGKEKKGFISLTGTGKDLVLNIKKEDLSTEGYIDKITPEMLKTGEWKNKKIRRYDVNINVPKTFRGKRHFVNQATDYARQILVDLGFKEMTGPILNTSFWNFDALFTAQDHPVREMQDTFFIKNPKKGNLPKDEIKNAVKAVHENGGDTGSTGWNYQWSGEDAKTNVLRTHTTVLSARTLADMRENLEKGIPSKYFAIGKCFRNETIDWSHSFEFNQFEGIVVDRDANFKHLLAYLKRFFAKLGFEKARFRPAYFPYTEMSVEMDIFHPVHKKWLELGGAGMFRPEVVKPLLGVDVPVLAWGPGFDRIMLEYYKINDIRELYKNDLKQLRDIKEWMR